MKPEEQGIKTDDPEDAVPITGDVIGDTAYSERFVLKILLKFANLDSLKDEIQEKSFEEDLCTLWDMTAEKDVVLFLLKHDVLNLFNFVLPVIESSRLTEIIVGIVGNMCCQKEAIAALLKMDTFLTFLLEYLKSDDSSILIQVLRLVSSCLFLSDEVDLVYWMKKFESSEYAATLFFILKNSSHKELLVTAMENFNTLTSYCNKEKTRTAFFTLFVTPGSIESLSAAFTEVVVNRKDQCDSEEIERILVISLQITLNLVGFDKSPDIFKHNKNDIVTIIHEILKYTERKFVYLKEIDSDMVDIIDSTNTIVSVLELSEDCGLDQFFNLSYNMWKALHTSLQTDHDESSFEEENRNDLRDFSLKIKPHLSLLICLYLSKCSEDNLLKGLDVIGKDYDEILNVVAEEQVQTALSKRATNYRTRLKDNVDS